MDKEQNSKTVPINPDNIKNIFSKCYDFEMRRVDIGSSGKLFGNICFIDGLVSGTDIAEDVIKPLTDPIRFSKVTDISRVVKMIRDGGVYSYTVHYLTSEDKVVTDLLNGFCAVFIDGFPGCFSFETRTSDKRGIDQPKEEKVVKGSKDAFIEILKTNTMLIRRKLKDRHLKIEQVQIGEKTDTFVAIVYIDGFTNESIIEKVKSRLKNINTDGVLTSSDIEENVVDNPNSPFPQMLTTERPDKFCLNILEGRVGILADGIPIGYLAPGTFSQFFKVPEDRANHFISATILTMLRYAALVLTLLLPAFYVAVAMYHQEMIPTKLMQSIIVSKQSVPFPTAVEVIAMLISFELLQEAGLRLPNPIGETVSIIGALIVGQSAVEAKVVSPVVIIVVAMAGIAGYTMPNQDMGSALRICRFGLVIAAIFAGMFGLAIGACLLIYHLASLESFGVPYMTPFVENEGKNIRRAIGRGPIGKTKNREPALFRGETGQEKGSGDVS